MKSQISPFNFVMYGITGLLVLIGMILTASWHSKTTLFAAALLVGISAIIIIVQEFKSDWREGLLLWAGTAFFLLGYPIATIAFLTGAASYTSMLPDDLYSLILGFEIGSFGWIAWVIGYVCAKRSSAIKDEKTFSYNDLRLFLVGLVGLVGTAVVNLFVFSLEGDQLFGHTGIFFSLCGFFGLISTMSLSRSESPIYRGVSFILLVLFAMLGIFSGQRFNAVKPLFSYMVFSLILSRLNGQSLKKPLMIISCLVIIFVAAYPILSAYKVAMGEQIRSGTAGLDRIPAMILSFDSLSRISENPTTGSIGAILTRVSHVRFAGMIGTWGRSQWGWLDGDSLLDGLVVLIPRFVWPDKPSVGLGEKVYALMGYKPGTGSATVPISADWYINFGWAAVISGMIFTGILYSKINEILGKNDIFLSATLAGIFIDVAQAGQGIAGLVSLCIIYISGAFLLRYIVMKRPAVKSEIGMLGPC